MRPSISVTLEPGLERGVPWGRDLYTFVTSAAGHMMRTLQKPRKNRPSKRQVNHRRFLHNMIQRKFADIEAANHRLASALYFKEDEIALPSHKPESLDQSDSPSRGDYLQDPDKCSVLTGADGISKFRSDLSETGEKKQPDTKHLWKRHPKTQPDTCSPKKNYQSKGEQKKDRRNHNLVGMTSVSSPADYNHGQELFHTEYYSDDSLQKSANNSHTTQQDSGLIPFGQNVDISPVLSPELSPLSLDSCDFSIQMFTDISCSQAQKNIADLSESQWTDIMDLFSSGNNDLGSCMDVESHFESICTCQEDAGQDVGACDVGFADQADSFTDGICSNRSEVEDLHSEAGEYRYQYGHSCHGDQGLTVSHFQRQNEEAAETLFHSFRPSQDINQNQDPSSISCHYNASELHTYRRPQAESPCTLANNQNFTPFVGVAQSFPVPLHNPEHCPIPTLPQEDDWLFTDILKDRKSSDC